MRNFSTSLKMLILTTAIFGFAYPFCVTAIAQLFFKARADGSLVERDGKLSGSILIGQKFEQAKYFWARPSATDFNTLASGGSNLGQASTALKSQVAERIAKLKAAHPTQAESAIPQDLLFASGSGIDPEISIPAALYQSNRVAEARGIPELQVRALIESLTVHRDLGIFGEPRLNVLVVNLALDQMTAGKRQ